jgi:hypothetical protein
MNAFERCLAEKRLVKVEPSPEMISKELESADYDYGRATGLSLPQFGYI